MKDQGVLQCVAVCCSVLQVQTEPNERPHLDTPPADKALTCSLACHEHPLSIYTSSYLPFVRTEWSTMEGPHLDGAQWKDPT